MWRSFALPSSIDVQKAGRCQLVASQVPVPAVWLQSMPACGSASRQDSTRTRRHGSLCFSRTFALSVFVLTRNTGPESCPSSPPPRALLAHIRPHVAIIASVSEGLWRQAHCGFCWSPMAHCGVATSRFTRSGTYDSRDSWRHSQDLMHLCAAQPLSLLRRWATITNVNWSCRDPMPTTRSQLPTRPNPP